MLIIYFIISFLATCIGSIAGIGGGIIIKPVLDLLGNFDVQTIGILSSFTVFAMAITSVIKQVRQKVKLDYNIAIPIALGSIVGGYFGEKIFKISLSFVEGTTVTITQNILMILISFFILLYMYKFDKDKNKHINNYGIVMLVGFLLGVTSSFLSIGGGPLNICVLMFLFSMTSKEAARNSILIILFTQLSSISSIFMSNRINGIDLSFLPLMIIGGVIGGFIGSTIQKRISSEQVTKIFNVVIFILVFINLINIVKLL